MLSEMIARAIEGFGLLPPAVHLGFLALFSGIVGSFVNVCLWRIPRGESIVLPRSHCTSCGNLLSVPDLVPVLSWLVLRGRCRHCGAAVSPRYVLVELAVIGMWMGAFAVCGPSVTFVLAAVLMTAAFTFAGITVIARRTRQDSRGGFTFISVMLSAVILAITVPAFMEATRVGFRGAMKNREHFLATLLAQERIEELRSIPVRNLCPDRKIYIETAKFTDNIFCDRLLDEYAKMRDSVTDFNAHFSDIYTDEQHLPQGVWEKFQAAYKRYYGFEYQTYPRGYEIFRRITHVQDVTDKHYPQQVVKKVIVTVEINSQITHGKIVELETVLAEH